jgi:nicotinamidase/pyrazinamidase
MQMASDLRHAVLAVIDVQNDFCPGGALAVKEGDTIIPLINSLMPRFPLVVATQDWHPSDHVSFASSHSRGKSFDTIQVGGISQVLWPDHCVQGTRGADFHSSLENIYFKLILRKGTSPTLDSYSAFFENDKKTLTGLAPFLEGIGVEDVYLCGLATDVCVFHSAMDAVRLGFHTFLIRDASRGVDVPEGSLSKAIKDMKASGVRVIESDMILKS